MSELQTWYKQMAQLYGQPKHMKKIGKLLDCVRTTRPATHPGSKFEVIPWDERPKIPRNKMGPFINGCIDAMRLTTKKRLGDWDKYDMDEAVLAQIIRDCASFYWQAREDLTQLWGEEENPSMQYTCGSDFWFSRQGKDELGYLTEGFDEVWERLHNRAKYGYGKFPAKLVRKGGSKSIITWKFPIQHKEYDPLKGAW